MPNILQSQCVNKPTGMRAAILAAVVALGLPSIAVADDDHDCAQGSLEVRIVACTNVLTSNPSSFYALANRGIAFNGTGEYRSALADLNEAFQHARVGDLAGLYLERGSAHEGLGNHKLAIADFNEAIRRNPSLIVAYFGRAMAYEATGQGELATADLDKAIELDRKMVGALYMQRGYALRSTHQYDKAIVAFNKTIDINPNWPLAYFGRGASYEEKGDWNLAAADYQKCLEFKDSTELVRQRQKQAREQLEKHL